MTSFSNGGRRALVALLPLLSILIAMAPQPVQAAGGIAMAGTFYAQDFEIPQGVEVSNESIYVVVFNESDSEFTVHLTATTPKKVELSFSEQDVPLQPGEQRKIYIGVRVGEDAVPGEYTLRVTAEGRGSGTGEGIRIMTAVAQEASLKVTGEAAWIDVRVVSPSRAPVVAEVRLFKETQGTLREFASSQTGTLEAKVSLGRYIVRAYVSGEKLAEETVDITAANERKEVTLVVKTVYFANFGFVRNYYTETGELAFAKVVYQVSNLYQPMADVELVLKVSLDGEALEEIPLLSLSELSLGDISGSRDYIPPQGWTSGTYTFQAELYVGGKLYTTSLEEKLEVELPLASVTLTPGRPATLVTGDGRIGIAFPQGSVASQVEVTLQDYPLEQLPSPPNGFELAFTYFRVDGLSGLLTKEATLTIKYSTADLERAEGDASRLTFARWDEANNQWSVLKTKVDKQAMTLTTTTNQFSIWAVMVAPPAGITAPSNLWLIVGIAAGVIIIGIAILLMVLLRRRRQF